MAALSQMQSSLTSQVELRSVPDLTSLLGCGSSGTADLGSPARYRTGNSARPSASKEGGGHTLAAFTARQSVGWYASGLGAARGPHLLLSSALVIP